MFAHEFYINGEFSVSFFNWNKVNLLEIVWFVEFTNRIRNNKGIGPNARPGTSSISYEATWLDTDTSLQG